MEYSKKHPGRHRKGKLLETIEHDRLANDLADMMVNRWGINLVSVESITVNRQDDGQLTDLHVVFIPAKNPD